jgi:membrane protein DedA with SNARE-associated domain
VDSVIYTCQHLPPLLIYLLVAAFLFLESSGIPLVNTTLLLFTGALAALGRVSLALLLVAAILGSALGACSGYGLGRRYGEALLLRLAHLLRVKKQKVMMAERWFQGAGARTVFLSRIVPYIRPYACLLAGISAMPFLRFLFAACSGSVLWCVGCLIVGWELGPRWKLALDMVRASTWPAIGVLLLLIIASFYVQRRLARSLKRRLDDNAEVQAREEDLLEV